MTLRLAMRIDGEAGTAVIALDKTVQGVRGVTSELRNEAAAANAAAVAISRHGAAAALNGMQIAELGHIARSVVGSLSVGISPVQALGYELNRIVSVLTIGNGGPAGTITAIGGAIAGLVNPATIAAAAIAGIGVAATLWLSQTAAKTVDATAALEEHKAWLDKILADYGGAKKAADSYFASVPGSQEGATRSNILAQLTGGTLSDKSAIADLQNALGRLMDERNKLALEVQHPESQLWNPAIAQSVMQLVDAVDKAGLSASSTKEDFGALITTLTQIENTGPPIEAAIARNLLPIVTNAEDAARSVGLLHTALDNLPSSFNTAQKSLLALAPDLRDKFTKLRDQAGQLYAQEAGAAPDGIQRALAKSDYDYVLKQINAAQTAELAKHTATAGSKAAPFDPIAAGQKDVAQLHAERAALGMDTAAAAALNEQLRLENEARRDNIGLTPQRLAAIQAEAVQVGAETAKLEALNTVYQQGQGFFEQLFASAAQNAEQGESGSQALGNAAVAALGQIESKALQMAADGIWNMIWGGGSSSGTNSGGLGGWVSSIISGAISGAAGPTVDAASALAWAAPAFGDGGWTGPGARTTVAGLVHAREFVVNADATARHRPLLEAINAGMPGYAAGGFVRSLGGSSSSSAASASAPGSFTFAPQTTINAPGADMTQFQKALDARDQAWTEHLKKVFPRYHHYMLNNPRWGQIP